MPVAQAQQTAVQVGSKFGLPGYSRSFEGFENNDGLSLVPVAASQKSVTGLIPFKTTDIVYGWHLHFSFGYTYAAGTTTLALSEQAPYDMVGPLKLQYQNQFAPLDVRQGFDAAIFQLLRPQYYAELVARGGSIIDASPATTPYNAGTNIVSSGSYTTGSTTFQFTLDAPGGLMFDRYYQRDERGNLLSDQPLRCFVSPQLMAGIARTVQPVITLNQAVLSSAAQAGASRSVPVIGSGTQTTPATVTIGTCTLNVDRYGYLEPVSGEGTPIVWPWQYTRQSTEISIAGVTAKDILIPLNGQILMVWFMIYDPSSGSFGAPVTINATNVSECSLLYASGIYKFQDDPLRMQRRWQRQHGGIVLPKGVGCWDMAFKDGLISNEDVLYTGDTSSILIRLRFVSAQSATAYVVVGVEALTFVVM
jgi:hypothetical protein